MNGGYTVQILLLTRSDNDGIEVVVAKLSRGVPQFRSESKVGSVAIPFAHRGAICHRRFFWHHSLYAPEKHRRVSWIFSAVSQRFFPKHGGGIRS